MRSCVGSPTHHPSMQEDAIGPGSRRSHAYRPAASVHAEPPTPLIATSPSRMRA